MIFLDLSWPSCNILKLSWPSITFMNFSMLSLTFFSIRSASLTFYWICFWSLWNVLTSPPPLFVAFMTRLTFFDVFGDLLNYFPSLTSLTSHSSQPLQVLSLNATILFPNLTVFKLIAIFWLLTRFVLPWSLEIFCFLHGIMTRLQTNGIWKYLSKEY